MRIRYIIFFLGLFFTVLFPQSKSTSSFSITNTSPIDTVLKIKLNSEFGSPPLFYQSKIYTTDLSGAISCFDISGKRIWSRFTSSIQHLRPVIVDNILCTATSNNEIITFNLETGNQIQSFGVEDSITTDLTLIQYAGDKELLMPKSTSSKSSVVFGTKSGKIYCVDLESLQTYWINQDASVIIKSRLLALENKILFTASDGFLYAIDARNGLLNWRWKEKAETNFSNSLIMSDGQKVYVYDNEYSLFSIDLLLGNFTWKSTAKVFGAIGISVNKKKLYAKGLYSKFFIISTTNGKVLKGIKRNDLFDTDNISPFEYKNQILFTNRNSIFSFDENFKEENVLFYGVSTINKFMQIDENKFFVSYSNGAIIIFKIR